MHFGFVWIVFGVVGAFYKVEVIGGSFFSFFSFLFSSPIWLHYQRRVEFPVRQFLQSLLSGHVIGIFI